MKKIAYFLIVSLFLVTTQQGFGAPNEPNEPQHTSGAFDHTMLPMPLGPNGEKVEDAGPGHFPNKSTVQLKQLQAHFKNNDRAVARITKILDKRGEKRNNYYY